MDDILKTAEHLADAISKHEKFLALRKAEQDVRGNASSKDLLERLNTLTMSLAQKEHQLQPIEPEEKQALAKVKEQVAADDRLQALTEAQADYSEMMNKINKILFEKLGVSPGP